MNKSIIEKRFNELKDRISEVDKHVKAPSGEFSSNYEVDRETFITWGMSAMTLLSQVFGLESLQYKQFKKHYDEFNGWIADYYFNCKAIFMAAYDDYTNGYIFNLRNLVAADLIDDGLSQAEEFIEAGYKDPACVVIGVCLETALKELCDRVEISHSKLDKMNADLKKAGTYNTGMQKQITAWADLRNNAAHGNWNEYTIEEVKLMLQGVRGLIAMHF